QRFGSWQLFSSLWKTIDCYRCWWIVGMGMPWHNLYKINKKIFLFTERKQGGCRDIKHLDF
ncbi:MAG: hypothetical protein OCC49_19880, partial [Fibrobacterales bacterium]